MAKDRIFPKEFGSVVFSSVLISSLLSNLFKLYISNLSLRIIDNPSILVLFSFENSGPLGVKCITPGPFSLIINNSFFLLFELLPGIIKNSTSLLNPRISFIGKNLKTSGFFISFT